MGRLDKYLDAGGEKPSRLAKYADPEIPPPAKLNENGLPEGFVGPPSLQDDPELRKVLPSIDTANRLRSEGRTVTGIDKSGMISLAPLPGGEVRSVMTREGGKAPQINTSAELADAASRPIRDDMKPTRAFVAGALDSATLGFGDEISAAIGSGDYTKERNLTRRLMNEEKAGDPGMALAGGVLGGMSLAPISVASSPVRMLAEGAAIGGTAALGSSEAELYGKDRNIGQAAWDVAKGAGIGLGGTAAVIGGQKVANAIRAAPERVLAKENQLLLDNLMHRFPASERREMIGSLGGNADYLIQVVREDPALVAALKAGEKVESGTILATKAEAERRAFAASVAAAQAERGPLSAQGAVDFLDREARTRSMSLIPSENKTAKSLADTAAKIREDILPVNGMGLVERVTAKGGADVRRKIADKPADYMRELEQLGVSSVIDDPVAVATKIKQARQETSSALTSTEKTLAKKMGQLDAAEIAGELSASKVPALNKLATKIKEESLPLTPEGMRSKILSRAGAEEQKKIINSLPEYQRIMDTIGLKKIADDPIQTYDTIVKTQKAIGKSLGSFKEKIDDVPLKDFSAEVMRSAQKLDETATAASGMHHAEEASAYITDLWRRYSPENVTPEGAIIPVKGRKDIKLPFEAARKELTDMQARAYGGPMMDPKPADKARRAIAGNVMDFLEQQAAASLPAKQAEKYIAANKLYSKLITLEDATEPARRAAILSPEAPIALSRTGKIPASQLVAMRNNATGEEAAALDAILFRRVDAMAKGKDPVAAAHLAARGKADRLATLESAIDPAYVSARVSSAPSAVKPRTGSIDIAAAIATRNEMSDEGAQRALGDLIESHLGKDAAGKIAAQEKRARTVEQMAKSLDYQARDTRSMINPGLRGISDETVGQVSKNAANMGLVGSAVTANPAIITAALALKLGVSGIPAKAAAKLDQAVAAMVAASRKGADHKALNKLGKLAGLSAEVSNDVALTIAQRVAPTYVGKEDR